MGRKEFIEAWNKAFFTEKGELNNATLDIEIVISFPGGTAQFGMRGLTPKTRINEIARAYADALPEGGVGQEETINENPQLDAPPAPPARQIKDVVANEHISYRNNNYLVQHYRIDEVDFYNIFNQDKNKVISPRSVTSRAILKRYRNLSKIEEEE